MAADVAYDDRPVPRGTSRRWEVIVADERRTPERPHLGAADVRAQHRLLRGLGAPDVERIALLPEGERLTRFRTYLDLHDPARADFVAEGYEVVKPGQHVIAQADTPREVWDRLVEAAHDLVGWRRRKSA